ncbi:MAG: hypothetical protein ACRD1T_24335 [Acidimicrobiia bacterium]
MSFSHVTKFLLAFLAIGLCSAPALAQQPFDPLSSSEIELAKGVLLNDLRVRQSLGSNPRYVIINVERHNEDKSLVTGRRRADVMLYNYTTDETTTAVVNLAGTPAIDAIRVTKDMPPPLGAEEVETATQLALANSAVQSRLQSAGVAGSDPQLIVTHLFGRTDDTSDPCSKNRCVLLFFNTESAFLFSAAVDLTERRVRSLDAFAR